MNFWIYKAARALFLVLLSSLLLVSMGIIGKAGFSVSNENLDYAEAPPRMLLSSRECWHKDAFKKYMIEKRKLRILAKSRQQGHFAAVYVNDHGSMYFVVHDMVLTSRGHQKVVGTCIFAALKNFEVVNTKELKNLGELPWEGGPKGIDHKNTKKPKSSGSESFR